MGRARVSERIAMIARIICYLLDHTLDVRDFRDRVDVVCTRCGVLLFSASHPAQHPDPDTLDERPPSLRKRP